MLLDGLTVVLRYSDLGISHMVLNGLQALFKFQDIKILDQMVKQSL